MNNSILPPLPSDVKSKQRRSKAHTKATSSVTGALALDVPELDLSALTVVSESNQPLMFDGPLDAAMVSGFGKYATDQDGATPENLTTITFNEIRALADKPAQVPKDAAQWVIPSLHQSRKGQSEHGRFVMLWLDIDEPKDHTITQMADIVGAIVEGCDFEIYASRSATEQHQKCRVLVPLNAELAPPQWLIASELLRAKMAAAGVDTDPATEKPGQVLYLPNKGQFYTTASSRNGDLFQPLIDWAGDIAARKDELAKQAAELEQAQKAALQARQSLKTSQVSQGAKSLIHAFNTAYDVAGILLQHGYTQRGNTFKHPASQTGSYSATVKDGRVHTLSTTDKLHSAGAGAHDAFSAFEVLAHGGNRDAALKDAGDNWLMVGAESWNAVARREFAKAKAAERIQQAPPENRWEPIDFDDGVDADGVISEPPANTHPLAKFVALHCRPKAVSWVIPGVIEHGVVTIAGARGVGKTTAILPLALAAAGLHKPDYPMAPKADRWRHVIYISEHIEQVQRIVSGVVDCANWGITWDGINERLHVVEAKRLPIETIVRVAGFYRTLTRTVDGVEILPLIVFDTQAASFAMENENDNSEASRIMAALKQQFHNAPIWIVGHVAKAAIGRSDIAELSARGAGAFEADSIQNLYLVKDGESRFLCIGKCRAEPKFGSELEVVPDFRVVEGVNEWSEPEDVYLRWASVHPMETSRKELKEQNREAEGRQRDIELRQAVMDAVDTAWRTGKPLSKTDVKDRVTGFGNTAKAAMVGALVSEGWLQEREVPASMRANNSRKAFLVRLSTEEHEAWERSGVIPEAKRVIPPSWRKPEIPPVLSQDDAPKKSEADSSH